MLNLKAFVFVMSCLLFSACYSHEEKMKKIIIDMQSKSISIPNKQMMCWQNDYMTKKRPWGNSKLKLIHYLDSTQCSSCYFSKLKYNDFFQIEKKYNYDIANIFIIEPRDKETIQRLYSEYCSGLLPLTIFVDTAHVFLTENPNIPKEDIYHTFLLDENNNIILVGNPYNNLRIRELLFAIARQKSKEQNIK